jgi:hypothetical protein
MKPKIIKSNQVVCDTPAIECTCGGSCFGMGEGNTYDYQESTYYCEVCEQVWELPSDVELKVVFTKRRKA